MCGRVQRPNRRQIGLICTQPSGEITSGAAEQNGIYLKRLSDRAWGLIHSWPLRESSRRNSPTALAKVLSTFPQVKVNVS
jgi:hypothetical protein